MNQLQMLKRALIAYVNSMKAIWSAIAHPLSIVSKRKGTLKGYRIYGNSVQGGEDLHDATKDTNGVYIDDTGTELTGSAILSDYIEVVSGANYTVKSVNAQIVRVNYYDSEKVWISQTKYTGTNGSTLSKTMTISDGVAYVRISYPSSLALLFYREVSPENPIEVQSVGELTTKNLFGYIKGRVDNGTILEELSTGAIVKGNLGAGNNTWSSGWFIPGSGNSGDNYAICPTLHTGDTVTVSADITLLELGIEETYKPTIYLTSREKNAGYTGVLGVVCQLNETKRIERKFTITEAYDGNTFYPTITLNSNVVKIENIQIEYGDTATDYEPYHKYKVPVTVRGKNLFDIDSYPLTKGRIIWGHTGGLSDDGQVNFACTLDYIPCDDLRDKDITINHTLGSMVGVAFYDIDKTPVLCVQYSGATSKTVTVPDTASYYRFSVDVTYVDEIQVECGNKATSFEPYIEPQTHNIYIDEPLRKIGDYADVVDFEKGAVVRNIGEIVVTSAMVKSKNQWYYERNWNAYMIPFSDFKAYDNKYQSGDYSNYFKSTPNGYTSASLGDNNVFQLNRGTEVYIITTPASDETVEEIRAWVDEKYNEGNPLKFTLRRAESVEEPISLPMLPQFKGTTVYEVQQDIPPSGIEVCYYE